VSSGFCEFLRKFLHETAAGEVVMLAGGLEGKRAAWIESSDCLVAASLESASTGNKDNIFKK
jgi:hypothetical protein